jgi:hypothetical protein
LSTVTKLMYLSVKQLTLPIWLTNSSRCKEVTDLRISFFPSPVPSH